MGKNVAMNYEKSSIGKRVKLQFLKDKTDLGLEHMRAVVGWSENRVSVDRVGGRVGGRVGYCTISMVRN